jgi:hypothetical protein
MTNTVSPETGRRLAAAGFPQPQPAPGQWWGDSEGLVFVFGETVPMPGINWIDENGIKLSYHFKLFYATYSGSDDSDTGAFLLSDTNPAEAAAIAYLSIHEKSKT